MGWNRSCFTICFRNWRNKSACANDDQIRASKRKKTCHNFGKVSTKNQRNPPKNALRLSLMSSFLADVAIASFHAIWRNLILLSSHVSFFYDVSWYDGSAEISICPRRCVNILIDDVVLQQWRCARPSSSPHASHMVYVASFTKIAEFSHNNKNTSY